MKIFNIIIASVILSWVSSSLLAQTKPDYLNAELSVDSRLDDLMARMTLEEKIGQMCQYVAVEHIRETKLRMSGEVLTEDDQNGMYKGMSTNDLEQLAIDGKIGSFLHVKDAAEANKLQRLASQTRLKIPLLIGIDAIHGHAHIKGTTVYPTQLGLSSTWDDELLYRVAQATAKEVRATGMHWTFSPNVDVARDPRWGRTGETFGEDPLMVTRMGVAFTKGYQGNFGKDNVLACAKHYIAGSEPFNGTNASPMDVSMRQLREVWLPPYKAQVKAGAYTVMTAHNEVSGIPAHGNKLLMTDILRDEWGFKGFVVSDWMDIERLNGLHHVVGSQKEAVKLSVESGMDMHMHGPDFLEPLAELVKEEKITVERINESARKILKAKFVLGLFESPYVDEKQAAKELFIKPHQELALESARKSIVLLKNEGLLPLKGEQKILITGPNANNHRVMGDWALEQPEENITTVYEGFKQVFAKSKIDFINSGESLRYPDDATLNDAINNAADYDAVVIVVGSNSLRYDVKEKNCGENIDRSDINLQGNQLKLVKEVYNVNKNLIVVFVNGRPLSEPWIKDNIPSIIEAWEPGAFAGQAIAEIIKGDVNPSGKLTMTIPYSVGQVPYIYNHKPSSFFHKYIDIPSDPLWDFGYGISYTNYKYSNLSIASTVVTSTDTVEVSVAVANTGALDGEEIVQLYFRDDVSTATRPVKELVDYKRVFIAKGKTEKVVFKIPVTALAYYDVNMQYGVEPGDFTFMVGPSSKNEDLLSIRLNVEK